MGKIYNIVFNSANGSGSASSKTYYIDWGQLPEGKYKCSFSFYGPGQTLTSTTNAKVYLDIGQTKIYEPQLNASATMGKFIGCLAHRTAIQPLSAIGMGSITGTTLTITSMKSGLFNNRMYIQCDGVGGTVTGGTFISSTGGTTYGSTGTYTLNASSTVTSCEIYGTTQPSYTLYADYSMNPPFYLDSKPDNNSVTLNIYTLSGASWADTIGGTPTTYTLNLAMELMDE